MGSSSLITALAGSCVSTDLFEVLGKVPDPRAGRGRVHPLRFVLAVAVVAFTTAGFASVSAAAQLAAGLSRNVLLDLGARADPFTGAVRAPSEATIRRVVAGVDSDVFAALVAAWTARLYQRATADRAPVQTGGLVAIAIDGKAVRGARRGEQPMPHLLAASTHHRPVVIAQRQIPAKTSEIGQVKHLIADLDLAGTVVTFDALHTQRDTAGMLTAAGAHYLMTVKANQPTLLTAVARRLAGPAAAFTEHTHTNRGHARTEHRILRAAPATGIDFPAAAQALRIVRYRGGLDTQRRTKEVVYALTSLPADLADPAALSRLIRGHWTIENAIHHVRDVTFAEDACRTRTGNAAAVLATIGNAVIAAFRLAGATNIAAARRWAALTIHNAIKLLTGTANQDISSL